MTHAVLSFLTGLVLLGCGSAPRPSSELDRARRIYTELRAVLTIGQTLAVQRGYLTPEEGDRALRVLAMLQQGLDSGAIAGAADGVLAVGDALLDVMVREGRLRPEESLAFRDLMRQLAALLASLAPPASQPAR